MKTEKYLANFHKKMENKKQAKTKQQYIEDAFNKYSIGDHKDIVGKTE